MTKKLLLILIACFSGTVLSGEKYILNEVLAVIPGTDKNVLILARDVRPSLDGRPRTFRDIVLEERKIQDAAEKLKMTVSEEDIDKFFKQLYKTNTKQQVEESLQAMGLTMTDAREQMKRQELIARVTDYRVRNDSRLVINPADIEEEWRQTGPVEEAAVTLSEATVKTALSQNELESALKNNTFKDPIVWGPTIKLCISDLVADKRFVFQKNVGDIVFINPSADGFEVTKLVAKTEARALPLATGDKAEDDKRFKQIEEKLRIQRFQEVNAEYEKSLLENLTIKFTYESDRRAVMGE
jgi:hypothetical protein